MPAVFDAWALLQTADVAGLDTDESRLIVPAGAWAEAHEVEIATVREEHARLRAFVPPERGLVHGDWGANNLLVDDGRISGILDWENATLGDPLRDVAGRLWATWPPVVTCMTRQAAYAERQLGRLPHFRERALFHDLDLGLSELAAGLADGDEEFAAWVLRRCLELLEGFAAAAALQRA
jgi:hygromycin-B 4-O-kinase